MGDCSGSGFRAVNLITIADWSTVGISTGVCGGSNFEKFFIITDYTFSITDCEAVTDGDFCAGSLGGVQLITFLTVRAGGGCGVVPAIVDFGGWGGTNTISRVWLSTTNTVLGISGGYTS